MKLIGNDQKEIPTPKTDRDGKRTKLTLRYLY